MIPWTKGMVEIYSILQTVFRPLLRQFPVKINEAHTVVHRDPKQGVHQVSRSQLPYELRYGCFSKTTSSISSIQL